MDGTQDAEIPLLSPYHLNPSAPRLNLDNSGPCHRNTKEVTQEGGTRRWRTGELAQSKENRREDV